MNGYPPRQRIIDDFGFLAVEAENWRGRAPALPLWNATCASRRNTGLGIALKNDSAAHADHRRAGGERAQKRKLVMEPAR